MYSVLLDITVMNWVKTNSSLKTSALQGIGFLKSINFQIVNSKWFSSYNFLLQRKFAERPV